jgi:hypothetical protein
MATVRRKFNAADRAKILAKVDKYVAEGMMKQDAIEKAGIATALYYTWIARGTPGTQRVAATASTAGEDGAAAPTLSDMLEAQISRAVESRIGMVMAKVMKKMLK